jgi:serine/threonine protein kinase/tetratricopeptide (TPR) repeat protein
MVRAVTSAGLRLGSFLLERPIARGGMAEVWRAVHPGEQVPVAIKVLTGPRARDEAFVRALKNEIHAVARLDHPGIIVLYDRGEVSEAAARASHGRLLPGSPWFAMEMCSHGALSPRRFPLPWRTSRLLLLSLLDALAHAHARGVVHRDLKPGNILLCAPDDPRPGLKLSDFGIAQAADADATAEKHIDAAFADAHSGTPRYMAPEQFTGRGRDIGPWTDLYALGCIAFQLVSGSAPFSGDPLRLAVAHCHDPVPTLRTTREDVPAGFEAWVLRLLEKDPRDRFRVAADAAWGLLQLTPDDDATAVSGSWADALRSLKPRPLFPDDDPSTRAAPRVERSAPPTDATPGPSSDLSDLSDDADTSGEALDAPEGVPDDDTTGPQQAPIASSSTVQRMARAGALAGVEQPTAIGRRGRSVMPSQTPSLDAPFASPDTEGGLLEDDDPFAQMLAAADGPRDDDDWSPGRRGGADDGLSPGADATDAGTLAPQPPWTELVAMAAARRDVETHPGIGATLERAVERARPRRAAATDEPLRKVRAPVVPPPLPPTWRRADERGAPFASAATRRLLGAGLGLFGLRQPSFVGRLVERSRLWGLLRRAHDERGEGDRPRDGVVVVRGAAGVGRTRLCTWLAERAAEVGAAHVLRMHRRGDDVAFDGLVTMLVRHVRAHGLHAGALHAVVAAAWPALEADDVVALARFLETPSRLPRVEALALLLRAVTSLAADRPVVVVVDDAHASADAIAFAAALAQATPVPGEPRAGVLVVLDTGDEALVEHPANALALAALCERAGDGVIDVLEADAFAGVDGVEDDDAGAHDVDDGFDDAEPTVAGPPPAALAADTGARAVVVLPLRPLPMRDHRQLVASLLGLEPGLVELLARRSAGSPRFAVELVGDLVERGVLEPAPSGFALKAGAAVEVPDDVHASWAARLHRLLHTLPDEARVCLELGALLGRDGTEREWLEVCIAAGLADPRGTIAATIDALERARFVVVEEGSLRFAHAMLRESMSRLAVEAGRAVRHHRVIASVLQRNLDATHGEHERCARHLLLAGAVDTALPLLLRATATTLSGQGAQPALALVDEVFSALEHHDVPERHPHRLAAVGLRARALVEAGRYAEGAMWARLVDDEAPVDARLSAHRALARAALLQGDLTGAVDRYARLLALAESVAPEAPVARAIVDDAVDDALLGLADGHYYRGQLDAAALMLTRAEQRAQARRDDGTVAVCLWSMAFVELWRGELDAARALLVRQQHLARAAGLRVLAALGRNALGDVERFAGRAREARQHYDEALRQLQQCGSAKARVAALNRALVDVEDDLAGAVARVERLLPEVERAGERGLIAACHGVLAIGACARGDTAAVDVHGASMMAPVQQGLCDGELAVLAEQLAIHAARLGDGWRAALASSWARELWAALGRRDRAER